MCAYGRLGVREPSHQLVQKAWTPGRSSSSFESFSKVWIAEPHTLYPSSSQVPCGLVFVSINMDSCVWHCFSDKDTSDILLPLYLPHSNNSTTHTQKKCDFLTGQLRLTLTPFLASVSSFTAHVLLQAKTAGRPGDQVCPRARGRRRSDAALADRGGPPRRQGECFPQTCGAPREVSQPRQFHTRQKQSLGF